MFTVTSDWGGRETRVNVQNTPSLVAGHAHHVTVPLATGPLDACVSRNESGPRCWNVPLESPSADVARRLSTPTMTAPDASRTFPAPGSLPSNHRESPP